MFFALFLTTGTIIHGQILPANTLVDEQVHMSMGNMQGPAHDCTQETQSGYTCLQHCLIEHSSQSTQYLPRISVQEQRQKQQNKKENKNDQQNDKNPNNTIDQASSCHCFLSLGHIDLRYMSSHDNTHVHGCGWQAGVSQDFCPYAEYVGITVLLL